MKHSQLSALFLLLAAAAVPASAGPQEASEGLQKIRRTFAQADRNDDGSLDPAEAKRATIPSADFLSQDHDADRKLSEDEFLVYYRELLVGAEQQIDADVEREFARIREARAQREKAEAQRREAEAARRSAVEAQAAQREASVVLSKNVSEKLQKAEAALDAMVAKGTLTRAEADAKREVLRQRAESVSGRSRTVQAAAKPVGEPMKAAAASNERAKVAAELKQLDDEAAAGRLSKADYEVKRAALLERARLAGKVGTAPTADQPSVNEKEKARGEAAREQYQAERAKAAKEQQQRERGEAAREQHQADRAKAAKDQQERERGEAAREQHQADRAKEAKAQKERERGEAARRQQQEAEKQRVERERLQREKAEAERLEVEKRRKDAERRRKAQQDAEQKQREREAKEDGSRKQP